MFSHAPISRVSFQRRHDDYGLSVTTTTAAMNGHSPGRQDVDDEDIELIGMDDVVRRSPPLSPKAPGASSNDSDDDFDDSDDGQQGLLTGARQTSGYSYPPPPLSRLQWMREIWEQIKWIVIEVRDLYFLVQFN